MNALFLLTFIGTMALSLWAAARVKIAYTKGSQVPTSSGFTGAEAATSILDAAGIRDVEIIEQDGMLGDHYDPMHKRLVLSTQNFHGSSAAALGVAAHECGHAIQHKIAYAPLQWRMASVGATTFASQIVTWLPLFGLFSGFGGFQSQTYLTIMVVGWGTIMLFNLVTLPVEFDASRRALQILPKMKFISPGPESKAVENVLRAAAWT
ncbi:MAG: zinc metallopeptidase, partial [Verrucomicrobia bacterium]|nr:zinc metallopeptidase [Verrucomicrobiota bacterium]